MKNKNTFEKFIKNKIYSLDKLEIIQKKKKNKSKIICVSWYI